MPSPRLHQVAAQLARQKPSKPKLSLQLRGMILSKTRWSRQKQMALLDLADDLAEHGL